MSRDVDGSMEDPIAFSIVFFGGFAGGFVAGVGSLILWAM